MKTVGNCIPFSGFSILKIPPGLEHSFSTMIACSKAVSKHPSLLLAFISFRAGVKKKKHGEIGSPFFYSAANKPTLLDRNTGGKQKTKKNTKKNTKR
jgi:hypothetical protein